MSEMIGDLPIVLFQFGHHNYTLYEIMSQEIFYLLFSGGVFSLKIG